MSGYVDSGYWELGYAIGDVVLPSSVNTSEYVANVDESFVCVPMQVFSDFALTYSIDGVLPSGITIDSATGVIQGVANLISSRSMFTMYGTDASGAQASCIFYLEVKKSTESFDSIDPVSIALSRIATQYRSR